MVEVYGEGILITGDSGIGKSETAIELIKRGHRLIADDAVEISKVICADLLGLSKTASTPPTPEARTTQYYAKRPCSQIVEETAKIWADYLKKRHQ